MRGRKRKIEVLQAIAASDKAKALELMKDPHKKIYLDNCDGTVRYEEQIYTFDEWSVLQAKLRLKNHLFVLFLQVKFILRKDAL